MGHDFDEPTRADPSPSRPTPTVSVLAGRYRLVALLGVGGMGSVYLAQDIELGEKVAVKMLLRTEKPDPVFVDRLRSEVRLARRVTHPNVARVYDIGEHEGERFLTMEYVDGESLGDRIARDGPLESPVFFRVARDLVSGLAAAHAAGVVHRDLKPLNVLLRKDGSAVITDFGTAGVQGVEPEPLVVGTPSYMAPEQFEARLDKRSDIFGLGGIFYCALTGAKPFRSGAPTDRPASPPNPHDRRPGLALELGRLVARCLEPAPEDRFPNAEELATALQMAAEAASQEDAEPATAPPSAVSNVLRAVEAEPRPILLRVAGEAADPTFAKSLRDEIADRLNEHAVLRALSDDRRGHEARAEIAVRRTAGMLALDLRVVGAREDFEIWKGTFEGPSGRAIELVRAAAAGIERALAVFRQKSRTIPPLDPDGSSFYLAGRAAYRQLWPDSMRRAIASFEQGLALTPDHPLLLAALAAARTRLSFFDETLLEDARQAAERAVSLAPDLAEAHFAQGVVLVQDQNVGDGVVSLLRALSLAPGHVEALTALADVVLELGAPSYAVRLAEGALAREPLHDYSLMQIARAHMLLGHVAQATEMLGRVQAASAQALAMAVRCRSALWYRDRPTLQAVLDRLNAEGADGANPQYTITLLLAHAALEHRPLHANEEHQRLRFSRSATRRRRAFVLQLEAEVDAYLEDYDRAITTINEAVTEGLFDAFWLERCPLFDTLRGWPRFEAVRHTVLDRVRPVLARLHATA